MNTPDKEYITRAEFEQFKQEIRQQRTDEMKAVRVDVHNVDTEAIRQELKTVSDTWLSTLQEHYDDHTARFERIESTMATKEYIDKRFDAIAEVQKLILERLPKPSEG